MPPRLAVAWWLRSFGADITLCACVCVRECVQCPCLCQTRAHGQACVCAYMQAHWFGRHGACAHALRRVCHACACMCALSTRHHQDCRHQPRPPHESRRQYTGHKTQRAARLGSIPKSWRCHDRELASSPQLGEHMTRGGIYVTSSSATSATSAASRSITARLLVDMRAAQHKL